MSELYFQAGDGKLAHSGSAIIYSKEPNEDLFSLGQQQPSIDFKAVATLVVSHEFNMAPFVVVDTEQRKIFVFGDIVAKVDGVKLDGSTTTTFIESAIEPNASVTCGHGAEISGQLNDGWARASGFSWGAGSVDAQAQVPRVEKTETVSSAPVATAITQPEPVKEVIEPTVSDEQDVETEIVPVPPEVALLRDAQPDPIDQGGPITSQDQVEESRNEPLLSVMPQPLDEPVGRIDELDPLADPGISLESIGAPEAVTDNTSPPVLPPPAETPSVEQMPALEPEPTAEPKLENPAAEQQSPQTELVPPPPSGVPLLQSPDGRSEPTIGLTPPVQSDGHTLQLDDGQQIAVAAGVYVGRHPSKNGLPDGYRGVTVSGDQVSRVHWELIVDADGALVRDLGSSSGTEVELNGRRSDATEAGIRISSGTKILFADRSATYELA